MEDPLATSNPFRRRLFDNIALVAQETQIPQDEERRLLIISEECRARERAAAEQLLNPGRIILYPEATRLGNAYQSMRIECKKKWLALRAYQKKMRDDRRGDKINNAAVLQAHSLFRAATVQAPPKERQLP